MTASTFIILIVVAIYLVIFWLMLVRAMNARLPRPERRRPSYRIPEVVNFILENPTKKHYIAFKYSRDETDVVTRLKKLGHGPDSFDLNFLPVEKYATGWSSVERDCCLSCTAGISDTSTFHQLSTRLRSPDAIYLLFSE